MISKYKKILDIKIQQFLNAVKYTVNIDSRAVKIFHPDYPILMPDSNNYYHQTYYQCRLDFCIRDYLITDVITMWLKISGIRCLNLKDKGPRIIVRFPYSNSDFGKDYPFAFIIEKENKRIGYRYSDINDYSYKNYDKPFQDIHSDLKILSLFKKYQLSEIIVIRWDDKKTFIDDNNIYPQNKALNSHIHSILITDLLNDLFSNEVSQLYIKCVREAISNAYKEIGYQTISNLSLKHLSYFKEETIQNLKRFDIKTIKYAKYSETGNLTSEQVELLHSEDYDIIKKRCYENNLIKVLSGKNKFARCFMTSEHLYEMFKNDNQNYYDYSTIVSGYFKSFELLLEEAMLATLTHNEHEKLWITTRQVNGLTKDKDWKAKGNYKLIKFVEPFKTRFSTEMGSLITFLENNYNDWLISQNGHHLIIQCFKNYNKGCRNEHLHKDIIDDIESVNSIRNNTILCLLFLLGGYRFYNNIDEDYIKLGINDNGFNNFYKSIKNLPSSIKFFYLKFNNEPEILAVRLNKHEKTLYDEFGNIISGIDFVRVKSFNIENPKYFYETIMQNDIIRITRECIPEEIYWYSSLRGKNQILW